MAEQSGEENRGKSAGERNGEAIGSGSGAGGGGAPEEIDSDSAGGGGADLMPKADTPRGKTGADVPSHGGR